MKTLATTLALLASATPTLATAQTRDTEVSSQSFERCISMALSNQEVAGVGSITGVVTFSNAAGPGFIAITDGDMTFSMQYIRPQSDGERLEVEVGMYVGSERVEDPYTLTELESLNSDPAPDSRRARGALLARSFLITYADNVNGICNPL